MQALVHDRLVRELDSAQTMLDETLEANRDCLPQFFKRDTQCKFACLSIHQEPAVHV